MYIKRFCITPRIRYGIFLNHFTPFSLSSRFERLKAKDNDFNVRFAHLGNLGIKTGVTEFNWDSNIDEAPSSERHWYTGVRTRSRAAVQHNPSYNRKNMMMIPKSLPSGRRAPRRPASPSPPLSSFTINRNTSPRVIDVPAESRLPASVGATSLSYNNTKQLLFASTSPIERKLHRRPQDHGGRPFKLTKQQITMQTLRDSPPQRKRKMNGNTSPNSDSDSGEGSRATSEWCWIVIERQLLLRECCLHTDFSIFSTDAECEYFT